MSPGAQATLDQLGAEVLDALYEESADMDPYMRALVKSRTHQEISTEEFAQRAAEHYTGDMQGLADFMIRSLTNASRRASAVERYILARSVAQG